MNLSRMFKSKLYKDTVSYTIINILDKAIPFLIMPIISRVLTKEDMGYYSLYQVTFQIFIPILTCCMEYPISINYFKIGRERYSRFFSTGVWLTLSIWGGVSLMCIPFLSSISRLFGLSEKWLLVTFVIVFLNFFTQLRKTLWQQQRNPIYYGIFSVPLLLVKNLLALYFILVLKTGWEGLILGHLIGQVLFSVIGSISLVKGNMLQLKFDKSVVYSMLKVGFPTGIHKLSAWFSHSLNRIIINSLIGTAATGSYGIGATFGTIVTVLEDAVNKAYSPYLFEQLAKYDENVRKKLVKLIANYYVCFIVFGVVMSLIGYYGVGLIFGDKYLDTRQFVIPIVGSAVINGLYKLHVNFIFFTEKTYIIARNTIICAVLNIPIAYMATKYMGIIGTAYSTIVIQSVLYLLTIYFANRAYNLRCCK